MSAGRKYWTLREWREQFELQGEKCGKCGDADGPFIAEHENPNYFAPGKPSWIICLRCDKVKFPEDMKVIAHVKRLNGEARSQRERRADLRAKGVNPWPSRPFPNSKRVRVKSRAEIMGEVHG